MSTRREKAKAESLQRNKSPEPTSAKQKENGGEWEKNLGKYLLDVSKYVLTGVVITSLFKDVTDKTMVYIASIGIVIVTLWTGLRLTNKRKD